MSGEIQISVITPYYNAENYLDRFFKSLKDQDFKGNFEVVMIDDASTDSSLSIINKNKLLNIKILKHNTNLGPASARNEGLKHSKGKYVFFFDVDDLIKPNTLSKLYDEAEQNDYDIVLGDKQLIENYKNLRSKLYAYPSERTFNSKDIKMEMEKRFYDPISTVSIFGLTGRLIKNSIIKKNKILFSEKLRYLEDETFAWNILSFSKNVKYIREQFYSYYVHPNEKTGLSFGLNMKYPISNFKLVKEQIEKSLSNLEFEKEQIRKISDQAFIFYIISALISSSKSIILKKVDKDLGLASRKKMISEIIKDDHVQIAIKNYKCSKYESSWIPRAISFKLNFLVELVCTIRAQNILKKRRNS